MPAAVQEKQTVHSVYVTDREWKRWQRAAKKAGYRTVSELMRYSMDHMIYLLSVETPRLSNGDLARERGKA